MGRVTVKAFAKVNMTLDVLGRLPQGYHELETLFCGVLFHDVVEVAKAGSGISLAWAQKGQNPGGLAADIPMDQGNLAWQAADLLLQSFPHRVPGVALTLKKEIPPAAGLAGGSADAAAVLLGINHLFQLGLSDGALTEYAAALGADVPFCLWPLAGIGRGRGDMLTPLALPQPLWIVLAKPPFGLSTKEVYGQWDMLPPGRRSCLPLVLEGLVTQDYALAWANMGNMLTDAAMVLRPELADGQRRLQALAPEGRVLLCGSGPTVAVFFAQADPARQLVERLKTADGTAAGDGLLPPAWQVWLTRTLIEADLADRLQDKE